MNMAYKSKHSTTSARVDLAIDNNGTWMDAFQFGTPDDFTWTLDNQDFECDVQLTAFDAVPLLRTSTMNGDIIIDDVIQRVIHFNVNPDVLQAALSPGCYVYDLVMVDKTSMARVPLMHGTLEVSQGVTYPEGP
jgi:hypothetical protein